LWVTTTGCAALTTTHWVVHGIHGNTANAGTAAQPAAAACLAKALILVLDIADHCDSGAAAGIEVADFAGWHLHGSAVAIDGYQLRSLPGGAGDLRATARV
jgi:hypothetical protein